MIGLTPTTFLDLHRLAEQLGVQLVRHSGGQKGWYNPRTRTEHRADQYAARLLITPEDFHDAYTWHGGHLPAIADDLEVTHHLLATWLAQERKAA